MEIRKIVVPLDGSSLAEHALPFATSLALASNASLHLVSVVPAAAFVDPYEFPATVSGALVRTQAEMRGYLVRAAARVMRVTGVPTTGETRFDSPVTAILSVVREQNADVIVMTSHGRGGIARAWLGSTADALVRHSPVPVLVLKPETDVEVDLRVRPTPASILVPLDGSPLAEAALEPALAIARTAKASITMLMVVEVALGVYPELASYALTYEHVVLLEHRERAERYLARIADRVRAEGIEVETVLLDDGAVAKAIVEHARDRAGGMIVMATHGRGGFRRLLMGSVADKVVRGSELPVMIVRPDSREHQRIVAEDDDLESEVLVGALPQRDG